MSNGAQVLESLEKLRSELLDLGRRSKMINFKPLRSKGCEIVGKKSKDIFKVLVEDKKKMNFVPSIDQEKMIEEKNNFISYNGSKKTKKGSFCLQTKLPEEKMYRHLLNTYRDARSSIQETGVNNLYLALGFIKWKERDDAKGINSSPLILVPVELIRSNIKKRFVLRYAEDDIGTNLSLIEKIKREFSILLPKEVVEESSNGIEKYYENIKYIVQNHDWEINVDEVHLGFFSFSKILMFHDSDPKNWTGDKKIENHPIISKLLGDGATDTDSINDDVYQENDIKVGHVLDMDSSQALALLKIQQNKSMIIQGPPGTGKSQTITNAIASAVRQNKKVLFVAEKMAALQVVKKRLDEIGLGEMVLEIHSKKSNKKEFLSRLKKTLEMEQKERPKHTEKVKRLRQEKEKLNQYCDQMNTKVGRTGVTPQQALGHLCLLHDEGHSFDLVGVEEIDEWEESKYEKSRSILEKLDRYFSNHSSDPKRNPFFECRRSHPLSPVDRKDTMDKIKSFREISKKMNESIQDSFSLNEVQDNNIHSAEDIAKILSHTRNFTAEMEYDFSNPQWESKKEKINRLISDGEIHKKCMESLKKNLRDGWEEQDFYETRKNLCYYKEKWWRFLSFRYSSEKERVASLLRERSGFDVEGAIRILDEIIKTQSLLKSICSESTLGSQVAGRRWRAEDTDWCEFKKVQEFVANTKSRMENEVLPRWTFKFLKANKEKLKNIDRKKIVDLVNKTKSQAEELDRTLGHNKVKNIDLKDLFLILDKWVEDEGFHLLDAIVEYNNLRNQCVDNGLKKLFDLTVKNFEIAPKIMHILEHERYLRIYDRSFKERKAIRSFKKLEHEGGIAFLRSNDKLEHVENRLEVLWQHMNNLPDTDDLGVLNREFNKKMRHLPIRKLMQECGKPIQDIKPIFMMSPLSISKFIPQGKIEFDLVLFDEASQVKPEDALSAVLRGRQVVVVGDEKQLPPTSFFDNMDTDYEEEENNKRKNSNDILSYESILSLFSAQRYSSTDLRWHYRSRHESLIAISNKHFYDSRLMVFPSPSKESDDLGLKFEHLPGCYYGGRGVNIREAEHIAKAVMRHAQTRPDESLGVGTFSHEQMKAIDDILDHFRVHEKSDACERFFESKKSGEEFFVKNLENIQGDERDVIFVSLGYGKEKENKQLSMNFGPINKDQGERRLNVLMTRARKRCKIFANFQHFDLDLHRTKSKGIRILKEILHFAETGRLDMSGSTGRGFDSPFERSVFNFLESNGHKVEPQVGCSGFYIDLAIVDPDKPGSYLLGIECDGATYHSSKFARDRDRIRQEHLENLGWRLYRIWSPNWFDHRKESEKELLEFIESVKS